MTTFRSERRTLAKIRLANAKDCGRGITPLTIRIAREGGLSWREIAAITDEPEAVLRRRARQRWA